MHEVDTDTREKLEDDLEALTNKWRDYDGNYMGIFGNVAYAQVKELLDRQAAITEREVEHDLMVAGRMAVECERSRIAELEAERDKLREKARRVDEADSRWEYMRRDLERMTAERDELNAKLMTALDNQKTLEDRLWEYDETHMELPVDADGVPIRVGDVVAAQDEQPFEVRAFQLDKLGWFAIERLGSQWNVNQLHHVKERTVEDVLFDFAADCFEAGSLNVDDMDRYAAELRQMMGGDA